MSVYRTIGPLVSKCRIMFAIITMLICLCNASVCDISKDAKMTFSDGKSDTCLGSRQYDHVK